MAVLVHLAAVGLSVRQQPRSHAAAELALVLPDSGNSAYCGNDGGVSNAGAWGLSSAPSTM